MWLPAVLLRPIMVLLMALTLHKPSLNHLYYYFLPLVLIFSRNLFTRSITKVLSYVLLCRTPCLNVSLLFPLNIIPSLFKCYFSLSSAVPCVPPVLSLSFLSLYFHSASSGPPPSLLLVPGSSLHCNQTPGISSRPTLAEKARRWQNTIVIIEAAAMLQLWQESAP